MFQKYFRKNNPKVIFKWGKIVFSENDGVQEEICRGAGRSCQQDNIYVWTMTFGIEK